MAAHAARPRRREVFPIVRVASRIESADARARKPPGAGNRAADPPPAAIGTTHLKSEVISDLVRFTILEWGGGATVRGTGELAATPSIAGVGRRALARTRAGRSRLADGNALVEVSRGYLRKGAYRLENQ